MKDFCHPNVLSLIGVVMNDQDLPMVVIPYMARGDLKQVLKDDSLVSVKPTRVMEVPAPGVECINNLFSFFRNSLLVTFCIWRYKSLTEWTTYLN